MELSKVFNSISHDFLISKTHALGFLIGAVTFFYSYLKKTQTNYEDKQCTLRFPNSIILGSSRFSTWAAFIHHIYISGYQKQTC